MATNRATEKRWNITGTVRSLRKTTFADGNVGITFVLERASGKKPIYVRGSRKAAQQFLSRFREGQRIRTFGFFSTHRFKGRDGRMRTGSRLQLLHANQPRFGRGRWYFGLESDTRIHGKPRDRSRTDDRSNAQAKARAVSHTAERKRPADLSAPLSVSSERVSASKPQSQATIKPRPQADLPQTERRPEPAATGPLPDVVEIAEMHRRSAAEAAGFAF